MGLFIIICCAAIGLLNMFGVIDTMPRIAKWFFHVEEGERDNIAIAIVWFLVIPFILLTVFRLI